MALKGRRMMIGHETESGRRLNEATIKYLTGGDRVTARGMYENFSSFDPTHKLALSTNYKPVVRGTDDGIWRRLKLIPFVAKFEGENLDKKMPEKLRQESVGILAWLVRGCLDWQRHGMQEPKSVQIATRKYAEEQDVIGQFLKAYCETGEEFEDSATELYKAFRKVTPECEMSQTAFGTELTERGYGSGRSTKTGRTVRKGLRLRATEVTLGNTTVRVPNGL